MQQHDFQQRLFSPFERLQLTIFTFVIFAKLVTKIQGINYRLASSKWFNWPDLKTDSILCQATWYSSIYIRVKPDYAAVIK